MKKRRNTITMTEANQNFSRLTKAVDKAGMVTITSRGEDAYVVMDMDTYLIETGQVMWGKHEDHYQKVVFADDMVMVITLKEIGDKQIIGSEDIFDRKDMRYVEQDGRIEISTTIDNIPHEHRGFDIMLFKDPEKMFGKSRSEVAEYERYKEVIAYRDEFRRADEYGILKDIKVEVSWMGMVANKFDK